MAQQSVKYSELRKKMKIGEGKSKFDVELANVTHYLQNKDNGVSHHFKPYALDYLEQVRVVADDLNIEYELPIDWDVPFLPTKDSNFKFIDLFARIDGFRLGFQRECIRLQVYSKNFKIPVFDNQVYR